MNNHVHHASLSSLPLTAAGKSFPVDTVNIIFDSNDFMQTEVISQGATTLVNQEQLRKTIELLKACRERGHRLFLLCNWSKELTQFYKAYPHTNYLLSLFDTIINTQQLGYSSLNSPLFSYVLKKYQLDPYECVFINGKDEKLEIAHKVGISKKVLYNACSILLRKELEHYCIL